MRISCKVCSIRSRGLCSALPDETLERINRMSTHRRVPAGRTIFASADEEGRYVATVISGVAKMTLSLPDGRTQVVGLHFPSDFIGRPFAGPSGTLTEAATDVELCCLERQRFETVVRENAGLEELFVRRMTEELDAARAWMLLLGHASAEERVATLLLRAYDRLSVESCHRLPTAAPMRTAPTESFELPLSRTEMAQFLGLTIETVSRMLRRLDDAGIVDIGPGRHITIKDRNALSRRAEASDA